MQIAFDAAEKHLGIPPLLEASDHQLMGEREVLTYLSFFYHIRARLDKPPPPAAPKAPERDELAELRALLVEKDATIARLSEQCNEQDTEIATLKHELDVATERIRIRDAEVVSLSEKNAHLDASSQELIREVRATPYLPPPYRARSMCLFFTPVQTLALESCTPTAAPLYSNDLSLTLSLIILSESVCQLDDG